MLIFKLTCNQLQKKPLPKIPDSAFKPEKCIIITRRIMYLFIFLKIEPIITKICISEGTYSKYFNLFQKPYPHPASETYGPDSASKVVKFISIKGCTSMMNLESVITYSHQRTPAPKTRSIIQNL